MKISIITICKNASRTIGETIQSITSQQYANLEYIVIDGNSTDGTQALFQNNPTVTHWISEEDDGISDAFNKGLALCTGDIVGILNADDVYAPNALNTVAKLLTSEIDILSGAITMRDGNKDKIRIATLEHLESKMSLNHPATFIRKSVYEKIGGYDPRYKYAMDYDLLLRANRMGVRIATTDEIFAIMRAGGLSDEKWIEAYQEVAQIKIAANQPRWRADYELAYQITRTYIRKKLEHLLIL